LALAVTGAMLPVATMSPDLVTPSTKLFIRS